MSEREIIRWVTVNGKHFPITRGDDGKEEFGVGYESQPEYSTRHRPGDPISYPDEVATVDKITAGDYFPDDILDHPRDYFADYGNYGDEKQIIATLKKAQKNPDLEVTIYRGAPGDGELHHGDWVTLSKKYAEDYAGAGTYSGHRTAKVRAYKAKVKDLSFDGDSIYEYGYWGPNRR